MKSIPYYVKSLTYNYTWTGSVGIGAVIKYSFDANRGKNDESLKIIKKELDRSTIKKAFELWENVANVKFVEAEAGDIADIIIKIGDLGKSISGTTRTTHTINKISYADIILAESTINNSEIGQSGFKTIIHEIGHALGLKHPALYSRDDIGPFMPQNEDNQQYSIMSYKNYFDPKSKIIYPSTPMIYDIAAIQYLYGPNINYKSDNTTYKFDQSKIFNFLSHNKSLYTIWDSGGNDIIDASKTKSNNVIDLREGINHQSVIGNDVFFIAYNSAIEKVKSGDGDDIIYGNYINNEIHTGKGDDIVYAGGGVNHIYGNACGKKTFVIDEINSKEKIVNHIYNFKKNIDKIDISQYYKNLKLNNCNSALKIDAKLHNNSLGIDFGNSKIILHGISEINADDFTY